MFVEIKIGRYHTIIDSDFTHVSNDAGDFLDLMLDVYSNKNLNVAANLALFIRWWETDWYHRLNFFQAINTIKGLKDNGWKEKIAPYKEDVERYLLLL